MCRKEAELFKVLGVESRIRIIDLLKQNGPLHVSEMAETLGITPSAVSQHLKILRHAGLVRNRRQGFWIPYEVDPAALEQCRDVISEVCSCGCKGTCAVIDRTGDARNSYGEQEVMYLRRLERELEDELQKVRGQIRRVEQGQ